MKPNLNVKERSIFIFSFVLISLFNLGFLYIPLFPQEAYQYDDTHHLGSLKSEELDLNFIYRESLTINPIYEKFEGILEFGVDGDLINDYEPDDATSYFKVSSKAFNVSVTMRIKINEREISNIKIFNFGFSMKNILNIIKIRYYVDFDTKEQQTFNNNIFPLTNIIDIEYKFHFKVFNVTSVEPNTVFSIITTEMMSDTTYYNVTSEKILIKSTIPLLILLIFNVMFCYFAFKLIKQYQNKEEITKGELQFSTIIIPNLVIITPLIPLILKYVNVISLPILWITAFITLGVIPIVIEIKFKNYYYKGMYTGSGKLQNNYYFTNTTNVRLLPSFTKRDTEGMDVNKSFMELFMGRKIERFHNQLHTYIIRRTIIVMLSMIVMHFFINFYIYLLPISYLVYIGMRRVEMNM